MIYTTKPEGMDDQTWLGILEAQQKSGVTGAGRDQKEMALRLRQAQMLGQGPQGRHWTRQATRAIKGAQEGWLNKRALDQMNAANTKQQGFQQAMIDQLRGGQQTPAPDYSTGTFPGAGAEGAPMMGPTGIPLEPSPQPTSLVPPEPAPGASIMDAQPLQGFGGEALPEFGGGGAGPSMNWAALGSKLGGMLGGKKKEPAPFKPSEVKVTRYDENGDPIPE